MSAARTSARPGMKYPITFQMLKAIFNSEDGLSDEVATRLYARSARNDGSFEALRSELESAFSNTTHSWKDMLSNDDYEVYCADSEEDARLYAKKILWDSLFGQDDVL